MTTSTIERPRADLTDVPPDERCEVEIRDPFTFAATGRCPKPATHKLTYSCSHVHIDTDLVCEEHTVIDKQCCVECATKGPRLRRHACPIHRLQCEKR